MPCPRDPYTQHAKWQMPGGNWILSLLEGKGLNERMESHSRAGTASWKMSNIQPAHIAPKSTCQTQTKWKNEFFGHSCQHCLCCVECKRPNGQFRLVENPLFGPLCLFAWVPFECFIWADFNLDASQSIYRTHCRPLEFDVHISNANEL